MGLNEAAGYGAVAVTALATGYLAAAHGLRPAPFFLGIAFAALGLGLSTLVRPRDPRPRPARGRRATSRGPTAGTTTCTTSSPTGESSSRPASASRRCPRRARPGWSTTSTTASPGGSSRCCSPPPGSRVGRIGVLAALYPAVWGLGQLVTGALSDRVGRKWLIAGGMCIQAVGPRADGGRRLVRRLGGRRRPARGRHRDGLPDAARRHRRRRPPGLAGPRRRHLPAVARRRLRRRCAPGRRRRRRCSASAPPSGPSPRSPRRRACVVAVRMYETRTAPTGH